MTTEHDPETTTDFPLDADSTEHLETEEGSEMVVGTERRDPTPPRMSDVPATERFRRARSMRPVGIDVLPSAQ